MKAPSEKHLEDWIVANLAGFAALYSSNDQVTYISTFLDRILARQISFPSGRPDLIAARHQWLYVVEIKREGLDTRVLAQCLRYMHDLQWIWDGMRGTLDTQGYNTTKGCMHYIRGILVGHSISDKNFLNSCSGSGVSAILYDFDGEDYTFEPISSSFPDEDICDQIAYGVIGQFMQTVLLDKVES